MLFFSHEGSDTPPNSTDIKVLISSLRSHVLKLRVGKKPGKQGMDLLSDSNESSGGIWNSITRHLIIFFAYSFSLVHFFISLLFLHAS